MWRGRIRAAAYRGAVPAAFAIVRSVFLNRLYVSGRARSTARLKNMLARAVKKDWKGNNGGRGADEDPRKGKDELRRIAEEQSALRRLATLVARGVSPSEIFGAVATEMGHLLEIDYTAISRFECDDTMTVVANWSSSSVRDRVPSVGSNWPIKGSVAEQVLRVKGPARMRTDAPGAGKLATWGAERGIKSVVGCPIVVEGRIWGMLVVLSIAFEQQPEATEARVSQFIELVSTAIANAESRAALAASRARIVAACDTTRRRIERNLHDGAQQRLLSLTLDLQTALEQVSPNDEHLREKLTEITHGMTGLIGDLQEISRGLHPAVLAKDGLKVALKTLARRSPVPVTLDLRADRRLDESVEVAVYYIVSEALTNAAKHARASEVKVDLEIGSRAVLLTVRDDGIGGVDPEGGSGLTGLKDRVEALNGTIQITSPPGLGTSLRAAIPCAAAGQ